MNGVRLLLATATWENLDEAAYLGANRDVRAAGITARQHLDEYGRSEGRPQFTRGFDVYRSEKFQRFRDILDLEAGCLARGTFPIVVGENHFATAEYVSESANPALGPFVQDDLTSRPFHFFGLRGRIRAWRAWLLD